MLQVCCLGLRVCDAFVMHDHSTLWPLGKRLLGPLGLNPECRVPQRSLEIHAGPLVTTTVAFAGQLWRT